MQSLPQPVVLEAPGLRSHGRTSLQAQIAGHLRGLIQSGQLMPGDRLPSTRSLARDWGLSRGTIVTALDILLAEELLIAQQGTGTFVSRVAADWDPSGFETSNTFVRTPRAVDEPAIDKPLDSKVDFRPCRPSIEYFPMNSWRKCLANTVTRSVSSDVGDPQGQSELREQIAQYVRRTRGLKASSNQVFISMGIIHAVHLLSCLYLEPGAKVIVEDPGYPLARQIFEAAGANVIHFPVDANGLMVEELPADAKDVTFLYVTPSHQFPCGGRLSTARRIALIEWATRNQVIILEDDYDGEFRYDVPPLPALASLENECVIYLGTFSKTMFPDVRTGYVISPAPVTDAIKKFRAIHEYGQGTATQLALANFIESGQFEAHVARMGKYYKKKRAAVAKTLNSFQITGRLSGLESGLHSILEFEPLIDLERLSRNALDAGVLVTPVSRYAMNRRFGSHGIVIGYAEPSIEKIEEGMSILSRLTAHSTSNTN